MGLNRKIYGKLTKGYSINIKRFNFEGSYEVKCPKCGSMIEDDFSDYYLSYPTVGETVDRACCCEDCETEFSWDIKIVGIDIEIEVDDSTIRIE